MMVWHPGRALLVLLALACALPSAALTFSGKLDELTPRSLALRLADGRVIDALLPRTPLPEIASIGTGDSVETDCKRIKPVWEPEASRYRFLEVTAIRLLVHEPPERRPSAAPTPPADDPTMAHAREVNLSYAAQLPNYVADETAVRYTRDSASKKWRRFDTIQDEIAIRGAHATRQGILRNGKLTHDAFERLSGFKWSGGFGTELRPVFDPRCPTRIEYAGDAAATGGDLAEYRFESPAHACFVPFYFEFERYNPARTGHVDVDKRGRVVRFLEEARAFPPAFEFSGRTEEIYWSDVTIAGSQHLLPVRAVFVVVYSSGVGWRVEVEYKNHRHFEASTTIVPLL